MMDYLSTHPTCRRSTSHLGLRPLTAVKEFVETDCLLRRKCPEAGITAPRRALRCHRAKQAQGDGPLQSATPTPPPLPLPLTPGGRAAQASHRSVPLDAGADRRTEGARARGGRAPSGWGRPLVLGYCADRGGPKDPRRARPPVTNRRPAHPTRSPGAGARLGPEDSEAHSGPRWKLTL